MRFALVSLFVSSLFLSGCLSDPPVGPTFQEQLDKDKEIINAYLSSKNITGVLTDPDGNGVRYKVSSEGSGIKPIVDDSIKIKYTLKLLPSETLIENPTSPPTFLLGDLILGWQIGIPLINEGSKATFYIPSGYAYGNVNRNGIPANSNLIFEVELLKVDPQMTRDTVAIDAYIASKSMTALKHSEGIRYQITKSAAGAQPTSESTVTFTYEGRVLKGATESTFAQGTFTGKISSLTLKGLRIGLPLIKVGSEVTFYIPSPLAFSVYGSSDNVVKPKSNVIYDIKLTAIQ